MAKSVREDFTALRAIAPWARQILAAAEAAERCLALNATTDALQARKESLGKEVAEALATLEKHKHDDAALTSTISEKRSAWQKESSDRERWLGSLDKEGADWRAAHEREKKEAKALAEDGLRQSVAALRREVAELRAQRDALQKDIAETLAKFQPVR